MSLHWTKHTYLYQSSWLVVIYSTENQRDIFQDALFKIIKFNDVTSITRFPACDHSHHENLIWRIASKSEGMGFSCPLQLQFVGEEFFFSFWFMAAKRYFFTVKELVNTIFFYAF